MDHGGLGPSLVVYMGVDKVPDYVADKVAKGTLVIVVTQVKVSLGGQIIG